MSLQHKNSVTKGLRFHPYLRTFKSSFFKIHVKMTEKIGSMGEILRLAAIKLTVFTFGVSGQMILAVKTVVAGPEVLLPTVGTNPCDVVKKILQQMCSKLTGVAANLFP